VLLPCDQLFEEKWFHRPEGGPAAAPAAEHMARSLVHACRTNANALAISVLGDILFCSSLSYGDHGRISPATIAALAPSITLSVQELSDLSKPFTPPIFTINVSTTKLAIVCRLLSSSDLTVASCPFMILLSFNKLPPSDPEIIEFSFGSLLVLD
jgi:hypothetical protein